jgi:hypothetical protein
MLPLEKVPQKIISSLLSIVTDLEKTGDEEDALYDFDH